MFTKHSLTTQLIKDVSIAEYIGIPDLECKYPQLMFQAVITSAKLKKTIQGDLTEDNIGVLVRDVITEGRDSIPEHHVYVEFVTYNPQNLARTSIFTLEEVEEEMMRIKINDFCIDRLNASLYDLLNANQNLLNKDAESLEK